MVTAESAFDFARIAGGWGEGHREGEVSETCPACGKPTKVWQTVTEHSLLLPCAVRCGCARAVDAESAESKLRRYNFPERFLWAESRFEPPEGSSCYLFGPSRSGKTTAACAIGRRAVEAGRTAWFATMAEVSKRQFSDRDKGLAYLEKLSRVGVLVLDDLGKGETSDWSVGVMFDVVNRRYNANRPLVVTSKFSLEQLARHLAEKSDASTAEDIVRRIGDMCKAYRFGNQRFL